MLTLFAVFYVSLVKLLYLFLAWSEIIDKMFLITAFKIDNRDLDSPVLC